MPSNKRVKLPGAPKQRRIPFVRPLTTGDGMDLRFAPVLSARSLRAIR